tara:strand:+ start:709 stop:942 length:234 start_codon:yes stop_codon:yes gene_type:complete
MNICVKYFASIRDEMGVETKNIQVCEDLSVNDLLNQLIKNESIARTALVAVNHKYVDRNFKLKDGDEVAFFPPVTGG